MTANTIYRRNITKSKAGHYRLTLISKVHAHLKVTSDYGWSTSQQAILQDEDKLADALAARVARITTTA